MVTEPIYPPAQQSAEAEPMTTGEAQAAGEGQAGSGRAEEATGLAGFTFSTDNSGELLPVNVEQRDGAGVPAVQASEEIYEGCIGHI